MGMRQGSDYWSAAQTPATTAKRWWLIVAMGCAIWALSQARAATTAPPDTLQAALLAAYNSNPVLIAERAKLRATDEQVAQALGNWRPGIDIVSSIGRSHQTLPNQGPSGNGEFDGTPHGYGIELKQPLFRGFRSTAQLSAAENLVLAERARLDAAEQQLFLDTATAFLDLVRDIALCEATRKDEAGLRKKLDEVEVRYAAGDLTQTDVHQAQSRLARSHRNRVQAENAIRQDIPRYRRLTGSEAPANPIAPDLTLDGPSDLEHVVDLAVVQNPNVIAAAYQVDEAHAETRIAKGALLPELALAFSATRNWQQNSTFPDRDDNVQVMLQLNVPVYHAGTDYSRTREAVDVVAQRNADLDEARRKAQDEAESAWRAMASAEESLQVVKDELESAALALQGVREESRVGTRTTIDVLNAEQELLDAQSELARSRHDRDLATLQLKAAIGQLTASTLALPIELYDPREHYDEVRNKWLGTRTTPSSDTPPPEAKP